MLRIKTSVFIAVFLCLCARAAETGVSIVDFGAIPDGKTDCSSAFEKAFKSGAREIEVPPGEFAVKGIVLPNGTTLKGIGKSSVVVPTEGPANPLVKMGNNTTIKDLTFDGRMAEVVCLRTGEVKDVLIENVTIRNFKDMAIETDHTEGLVIRGCHISRVKRATNIQFSRKIKVINNTVEECFQHGMQFWGNWKWERKGCFDLQFIGNYVKNGGAGAIWGAGAKRVLIANNIVDGAEDVGIDLEWCDDSVISGNVVRNTVNAGIALFFACKRISITGNTIINDHPISDSDAKAEWWVRSGIWLTFPNREKFKNDFGHRDISIVGNTIFCAEGKRRAMWIGSESDNVTIASNTLSGGEVWHGGEHKVTPLRLRKLEQDTILRSDRKTK